MYQSVPSWDLDDSFPHPNLVNDAPSLDYEVEEITLPNGELAMLGLSPPGLPNYMPLSNSNYTLDHDYNPQVSSGTLESIVHQATAIPNHQLNSAPVDSGGREREDELMFWLNNCLAYTMTRDALVPSPSNTRNFHQRVAPSKYVPSTTSTCLAGGSSGAVNGRDIEIACDKMGADNEQVYQKPGHSDIIMLSTSKAEQSMISSATRGDRGRFTATHMVDNHDSICHRIPQVEVGEKDEKKGSKISSFLTKIRRAAVHNKSERNRRDRINQKMKALQKLVPNSSNTTNKASMLDEVIEYLKQLEAQVQVIRNTMMYSMMLPMTSQQQLQMSMMSPAMRMAGLMDINALTHPNVTATSSVLHPAFSMHVASSVSPGGHPNAASTVPIVPNPLSTFQSQPMTVDAYNKMAALHHQQYLQLSANVGPRI